MYKKLLIASAIIGLVGCGSSDNDSAPVDTGDDDPINNVPSDGNQEPTNVVAIIAGTASAKIYNDE